jgi:hypothetical protein
VHICLAAYPAAANLMDLLVFYAVCSENSLEFRSYVFFLLFLSFLLVGVSRSSTPDENYKHVSIVMEV